MPQTGSQYGAAAGISNDTESAVNSEEDMLKLRLKYGIKQSAVSSMTVKRTEKAAIRSARSPKWYCAIITHAAKITIAFA